MTIDTPSVAAAYRTLIKGAQRDADRIKLDLLKLGVVGTELAAAVAFLTGRAKNPGNEIAHNRLKAAEAELEALKDTTIDVLQRSEEIDAIVVAYQYRLDSLPAAIVVAGAQA